MQDVTMTLGGRPIETQTLIKLEAARARYMMSLLMRKLGPQGMTALFADEIAAADAEMRHYGKPGGAFVESVVHAQVRQGHAREFIDWFIEGYGGPSAPAMLRAHPEHLGAIRHSNDRIGIIEVPGHTANPAILYLSVLNDWPEVPIALDIDMPHRIMGRGETEGGETIAYLLHQFADTNPGFKARLAIYWRQGTPDELVKGHAEHLAVEFNNWFQMYVLSRSQNVDLMSIALTCGTQSS